MGAVTDTQLVERAVRNAGRCSTVVRSRWAHVRDLFAIGSTRAVALCVRQGLDPDEPVGHPDEVTND